MIRLQNTSAYIPIVLGSGALRCPSGWVSDLFLLTATGVLGVIGRGVPIGWGLDVPVMGDKVSSWGGPGYSAVCYRD